MTKFELFKLLRHNTKLGYKRSPAFEQNQWAKLMMYIGGAFFALYLMLYGAIIGLAAKGEATFILTFMFIILPIDFSLRFIVQQTPAMMVKPYILLPISRYTAIECFLLSSHVSGYNLLWLMMFVTYTFVALFGGASFGALLVVLIISELLIMLNSQIYLFFRTLINRHVWWLIAALAFYALPYLPLAFDCSEKMFEKMLDAFSAFFSGWYVLPLVVLLIVGLFFVNRYFQFRYVYEEISKKSASALKHVSQFSWLNRFGMVGEYMKLELKMILRCKTMRQRTITTIVLVILLSLMVAYTNIYDGAITINFFCLYCFSLYSVMTLIKIMGQEGNYIDLLMTRRESILKLLEAKLWLYSALLIVPFIIMLPAVFTGKFSLLMLLGYMFLTAGLIHFIIFQLAVYNKQTLP
ncbi:MAG: DUF5687 family protein, partial [Prevotella sp.]|nr:DUF5687 family protein [Prevotella sp.]